MTNTITAHTEINMVVNGKQTFTIRNSPELGLLWLTKASMDRDDYIQGLFALAEAAYNSAIHSIKMDEMRIKSSKEAIDNG